MQVGLELDNVCTAVPRLSGCNSDKMLGLIHKWVADDKLLGLTFLKLNAHWGTWQYWRQIKLVRKHWTFSKSRKLKKQYYNCIVHVGDLASADITTLTWRISDHRTGLPAASVTLVKGSCDSTPFQSRNWSNVSHSTSYGNGSCLAPNSMVTHWEGAYTVLFFVACSIAACIESTCSGRNWKRSPAVSKYWIW